MIPEHLEFPWKQWQFVATPAGSAAFNMACDDMLMQKVVQSPDRAYIRAYQWNPNAFTIGYSQRAGEELNVARCKKNGYDVVRRPTGGRVVLHGDEIAYTIVCAQVALPLRAALSYALGEFLIALLKELHCTAELVTTGAPPRFMKNVPSICFTHMSAMEVMVKGKKIVGRALREKNSVRLEQGFIMLGDSYMHLPRYMLHAQPEDRELMHKSMCAKTISLLDATGKKVLEEDAKKLFKQVALQYFPRSGTSYTLTPHDTIIIEQLISEKYGNAAWTEQR